MAERTSPKRRNFVEDPTASLFDHTKIRWLMPSYSQYTSHRFAEEERQRAANRQCSGRSLSADVCLFRKDSMSKWNECYINYADHTRPISYRWMPETGISMSRYIPSPLARRTSDGDRPTARFPCHQETLMPAGSTRWMHYVRNPSPCSLPRIPSERRTAAAEPTESSQSTPARRTTDETATPRKEPLARRATDETATPRREPSVRKTTEETPKKEVVKTEDPPSPLPPPPPPPPLMIIPPRDSIKKVEVPDWHSIRKKPGRFETPIKKPASATNAQGA